MDAEWQYNLLDEDMSLIMDLNDPFGSIPPEMDLSLFDSYQPADDTALTMRDPLLGLAIACDEYLPDGAYPDFLADVTSRTDNSSFPNTDCPTTFDELIWLIAITWLREHYHFPLHHTIPRPMALARAELHAEQYIFFQFCPSIFTFIFCNTFNILSINPYKRIITGAKGKGY
ncbi:hypothetical protein FOC4_h10017192, partial [Fusarium odoratissimum]|uniref:Uncharacterized protein n=3 Tax=Fusarium oxysporum species complex TaxID=171631 RepID=X0J395_FUSO5